MVVKLKNNVASTLRVQALSSDTTIYLPVGHGARFPTLGAGEYFYATIEDAAGNFEIVRATARVTDTLTVVRAAEGTTARTFPSGTSIEMRVTAASVVDTAQDAADAVDLAQFSITASAAEINILDGATLSTAELNLLDGVTATTAELNILDGVTATTAELNILDGITATTAELNKLSGTPVGLTALELGYVDGVTSAIQTQLNGKQATITGAATTITGSNLTVSRALASDASGKVVVSTVTDTELGYLSGVTSSVQTQINGRVSASVDTNTTAGYTATADADGTFTSGTYTPTPSGGNIKTISNGGAFTIAAPSAAGVYTLIVEVSNVSGAGAITMSSFARVVGDPFTTTVGHRFQIIMTKTANGVVGNVVAMQ